MSVDKIRLDEAADEIVDALYDSFTADDDELSDAFDEQFQFDQFRNMVEAILLEISDEAEAEAEMAQADLEDEAYEAAKVDAKAEVREEIYDEVRDEVYDEIRDELESDSFEEKVTIREEVRDELIEELRNGKCRCEPESRGRKTRVRRLRGT
ncbi:MAG: hypothetical protein ACW963_07105 [Candidatus Sifarchaeia archaeon]|jgi:glycine betaine transporter